MFTPEFHVADMNTARVTVPGLIGVVTMGLFDLAYAMMTPCSLAIAPEFHSVPWTLGGCRFGMRVTGLFVTLIGALVGFVLGWAITNGPIGHR